MPILFRPGRHAVGAAALLILAACSEKKTPPPTPESDRDAAAASAPAGPAPRRTNQDKPHGATGPKITAPTPTGPSSAPGARP